MEKCWSFCWIMTSLVLLLFPFMVIGWIQYPSRCNVSCIQIYQWSSGFASLHVPKYTVQIIVQAWHVTGVYDVQIGCPAFASTTLIDPKVFQRTGLSTCLLKSGQILQPGEVITFEYSNILPYPFDVLHVKCL